MSPDDQRLELLTTIAKSTHCDEIIAFIGSDKVVRVGQGSAPLFQLSSDSLRILIDHLQALGKRKRIGLYLYSRGGDVSVPWVMVNLFRRYCDELVVVVPYRAQSAGTMIALGADEIIMGKHAELGPIDPTMTIQDINPEDPTKSRATTIAVEDITSFISLVKDGVGLTNQRELAESFNHLSEKVGPVVLGTINRQQSYIRMVATKLLQIRKQPPDASTTGKIVEGLIREAFFHLHAIPRDEARKDFGLENIGTIDEDLENQIWQLYLMYEKELGIGSIVKAEDLFQLAGPDENSVTGVVGVLIESQTLKSEYVGDLFVTRNRRTLPSVNLNLNLSLPPQQTPGAQMDPKTVEKLQQVIQKTVQDELRRQAGVTGYSMSWKNEKWRNTPRTH